jgi:hypothetical protein
MSSRSRARATGHRPDHRAAITTFVMAGTVLLLVVGVALLPGGSGGGAHGAPHVDRGGGVVHHPRGLVKRHRHYSRPPATAVIPPPPPVALTIDHRGRGEGTVSVFGGGSCSDDCTIPVTRGRVLTLTAASPPGAVFDGWTAPDACRATTTCDVQVRGDMTVAAHFSTVRPKWIAITIDTAGPGSVDLCAGARSCSRTYKAGTKLVLGARPRADGGFRRWDGCATPDASCHVTLTRDRTVTARFWHTTVLTTSVAGDASARLHVGRRGSCVNGCTFRRGARAQLRVIHDAHATVKWSDERCHGDTCTVRMTRDRTVKATISHPPPATQSWHSSDRSNEAALGPEPATRTYTLDVRTSAGGSVEIGDVRCQSMAPCRHAYRDGTSLTLVAQPEPGFAFGGWAGCAGPSAGTCDVTLASDRAVVATFTPAAGG